MKKINQNFRFSIYFSLLVLLSYVITPSAMANHISQSKQGNLDVYYFGGAMAKTSSHAANQGSRQFMVADNSADEEVDMQTKRENMIKDCEDNRGVDCEEKVDVELEAQQLDNKNIIYQDGRLRPRPRPRVGQ